MVCNISPRASGWNRENPKEIHEEKCSLVKLQLAESERKGDECFICTKYISKPMSDNVGLLILQKMRFTCCCSLLCPVDIQVSACKWPLGCHLNALSILSNYRTILPPALCSSLWVTPARQRDTTSHCNFVTQPLAQSWLPSHLLSALAREFMSAQGLPGRFIHSDLAWRLEVITLLHHAG